METKDTHVITYLEPTFYRALCKAVSDKKAASVAAYVRALIIKDLREKELVTSEVFEQVMT